MNFFNQNILSPLNFGASFIKKTPVGAYSTKSESYKNKDISFVEIDCENKKDMSTLEKISKTWGRNSYANDIFFYANFCKYSLNNKKNLKIYALTTQNKDFEKLDFKEVIGLAETSENMKDIIHLEYLQAKPALINAKQPTYKGMGTAIINCIKELSTGKKAIILNSVENAKSFYEKNGFELIDEDSNQYLWRA